MSKTLTNSTVCVLGPQLGLCIAMGSASNPSAIIGHLFPGSKDEPPPADLVAVLADNGNLHVTALTPDGEAFLELVA